MIVLAYIFYAIIVFVIIAVAVWISLDAYDDIERWHDRLPWE